MKNVSVNLQHILLLASKTKVTVAKSGAKIALIKTQHKQKHKRVDISVMTWGEIITKRYGNLPLAFSIRLFDNIGNNDISSTIVKWFLITYPWWRHQMETFSTSLAICVGNSPVTGEFPTQRPVSADVLILMGYRATAASKAYCHRFMVIC